VLKLLAFVLPLGLDSFAVAAAIGASQVTTVRQRLRISLIFVVFEGGMPLIGLALGAALARGIGQVADYVAGMTDRYAISTHAKIYGEEAGTPSQRYP
jgi:putative Mn2+ efflux pump MntP